MLLLHSATVAGLLPADVLAISRGESHHKTRLRKERPVPQPLLLVNIEGVTVMSPCIDFGFLNFFWENYCHPILVTVASTPGRNRM